MTSTTPPPIQAPTSKERKYDRQLRLWAANGQQALEEAHILLITANVVGVETVKNLVLPGAGHFTIVDPVTVNEEDLGVNFFLEQSSLGKNRASECWRLLQELNPDVQGHFLDKVSWSRSFIFPRSRLMLSLVYRNPPQSGPSLPQTLHLDNSLRTQTQYRHSQQDL